ncbi:hypothetical protein OC846_006170 [Tilletia horrida]|uniref:NADH dehydrogenase [ubiquinone] 1 alpha subcomplex assembly factor 3 n=1 Tax=Tilletia horrida TaxID=155126 RepID=A0AAN6JQX6_9BASI|nr:hypothetical protein OC846_006170 [Tilletia horrida]KAK0568784.1 hypothetical protein OC861_001561 [Tilletia horrida]
MSTASRLGMHAAAALRVSSRACLQHSTGAPALCSYQALPSYSSSSSSRSFIDTIARRGLSSTATRGYALGPGAGGAGEPDPGGKPNDGSHPTVYDDFYNITSAPGGAAGAIAGGATQIASMDDTSFTLDDGLVLACPIFLLSGGGATSRGEGSEGGGGVGGAVDVTVLMWDAPPLEGMVLPNGKGWEEWISQQDAIWKALEIVQPRPEILLFGTGKTVLPLPQQIKSYLNSFGVQVDVQSTRAACSTYNLLIEEGRRVGAALLPNIRKPMPRG